MPADKITLERIEKLHPKIRKKALDAYNHINEKLFGKGVRLRFAYTTRTKKEQTDLYALGRTVKGKKVTNATWEKTYHFESYALAFDIVVLYDLNGDGVFETASWDLLKDYDKDGQADWMEAVKYFKSQGFTWGGDFSTIPDSPHFQADFGYSWQKLYDKYLKEDFIPGTKYVNI